MFNAFDICRFNKKKFYLFKKLKSTITEIEIFSKKYNISKDFFIESDSRNNFVNILLLPSLCKWACGNDFYKNIEKDILIIIDEFIINKDIIINNKIINIKIKLEDNIEHIVNLRNNYINVSQISKITKKILGNWIRAKKNIEIVNKNKHFLIDYIDGTYAHFDIARDICNWCSPYLEKQINFIINKNDKTVDKLNEKELIIKDFSLKLKNNNIFIIPIREDGYVNATQLCKAGNKGLNHYTESSNTKEFLDELSVDLNIPKEKLYLTIIGGKNPGTWVHRRVATHLAQWISPSFCVQVSKWLDELLLTGKVELGKEKNNDELDNIYKDKILKLENNIKTLSNENSQIKNMAIKLKKQHTELLKKKNYYKFKKGFAFYIIKDDWREKEYLKFGITNDINERLQTYRTDMPECKILFLIYTENNKLIEDCIKQKYNKILTHQNHEYVINIDISNIKREILKLLKYLNIDFTEENNLNLYNNDDEINILEKTDLIDNEDELNLTVPAKIIECSICNLKFKCNKTLNTHLKKEHDIIQNPDNQCHLCDKKFSTSYKLQRHIDDSHLKVNEVKCDQCFKIFRCDGSLKSHIQNVHDKSGQVTCSVCQKTFSCNTSLRLHMKNIHNNQEEVKCDKCGNKFKNENGLKSHIKLVHNTEKTKCEYCDKEIRNYKYHLKIVHNM
jgi:hypothetical protein